MADRVLDELISLHDDVDRGVAALERRHVDRLQCRRGCTGCCVDDLGVFEVEATRIRRRHPELLRQGRPHPTGACAFLDSSGACRIYADRPYVCRTQGLPLRWIEPREDGSSIEWRDICPLNDRPDAPIEALPASACWTLGTHEGRLATLQVATGGEPPRRVRLRDLFEKSA